jgi:hypothetical protein
MSEERMRTTRSTVVGENSHIRRRSNRRLAGLPKRERRAAMRSASLLLADLEEAKRPAWPLGSGGGSR